MDLLGMTMIIRTGAVLASPEAEREGGDGDKGTETTSNDAV
jgi:hypothetical protein